MNYNVVSDPVLAHWIWYLYYIPILLIPLFGIFIAKSLFKPENYCMPKRMNLFYIPSILLLVLVLTNDLHQMVFTFPPDATEYTALDYGYGKAYYFCIGWIVFCAVFAFVMIVLRNRKPDVKKRMVIPILLYLVGEDIL